MTVVCKHNFVLVTSSSTQEEKMDQCIMAAGRARYFNHGTLFTANYLAEHAEPSRRLHLNAELKLFVHDTKPLRVDLQSIAATHSNFHA